VHLEAVLRMLELNQHGSSHNRGEVMARKTILDDFARVREQPAERVSGDHSTEATDEQTLHDAERVIGVPRAAKVTFGMTVTVVSLAIVAAVVMGIVWGDSYSGGFAVGYIGGPFIVFTWVIALLVGIFGFFQSVRRRSTRGVLMSLTPWIGTVLVALLFAA
jgi:hypothetical protein